MLGCGGDQTRKQTCGTRRMDGRGQHFLEVGICSAGHRGCTVWRRNELRRMCNRQQSPTLKLSAASKIQLQMISKFHSYCNLGHFSHLPSYTRGVVSLLPMD
ncbi:uncharacterized protein LOC144581680 [Callithrix jacchus]